MNRKERRKTGAWCRGESNPQGKFERKAPLQRESRPQGRTGAEGYGPEGRSPAREAVRRNGNRTERHPQGGCDGRNRLVLEGRPQGRPEGRATAIRRGNGDMGDQTGELTFRGRSTGRDGRAAARHPPDRRKFRHLEQAPGSTEAQAHRLPGAFPRPGTGTPSGTGLHSKKLERVLFRARGPQGRQTHGSRTHRPVQPTALRAGRASRALRGAPQDRSGVLARGGGGRGLLVGDALPRPRRREPRLAHVLVLQGRSAHDGLGRRGPRPAADDDAEHGFRQCTPATGAS